jgi:hypothetical protein
MAACRTCTLRPLRASSRAPPSCPPARHRHASSTAASAAACRHVPYRHAREFFQPKVCARVKPHHVHAFFEHFDKRHEQGAVQSIFVKLDGRHIRGSDNHDAALEQLREQAAEDHCIGDVGDVKFVEAQKPRLASQIARRQLDRVRAGVLADLHSLPEGVNAFVHVEHEFVEMRATLAHRRACFEKQVHQHCLAASDFAEDVEALERDLLAFAAGEQPA